MYKRIALLAAMVGFCLYTLVGYGVVSSKADDVRPTQGEGLAASVKPAGDAEAGTNAAADQPQVRTASGFLAAAVDVLVRRDPATAAIVASGGVLLLFLRYRKRLVAGRR